MLRRIVLFIVLLLLALTIIYLVQECSKPPVTPTPTVVVPTSTFTPTKTKWPTVTPFIPTATFTRRPTATPITPTATITRHPTATVTPTSTPKKLYWNWCTGQAINYPPYRMDRCKIKESKFDRQTRR